MYLTPVTEEGLGHHTATDDYFQLVTFEKGLLISEICWTIVIWTVKFSILAFYWRLFSANRRSIQVIIWILAAVVMVWGVAVVDARPLSRRDVSVGRYLRISDNSASYLSQYFSVFLFTVFGIFKMVEDVTLPLLRYMSARRHHISSPT